ncbi:WhiB family transcriptional regulator [Streptomyces sp. G-G2]|uniref:WhiB family transcriptional regulator n=1 Tax=Streptomyces sp. G-G2 TaxID=3046201 RepID=UPI0024B89AD6|nr:WhiB family transcriptional regulator [Streptomyces sp. G-G2]MDJ0385624.1 WhiB family transcriptional regulator [Streptomyces sp. G-G2]
MTQAPRLPGGARKHWMGRDGVACGRPGPDRFFRASGARGEDRAACERAAKDVCALCPVQVACLRHALDVREPHGMWGGLTQEERRALIDDPAALATV